MSSILVATVYGVWDREAHFRNAALRKVKKTVDVGTNRRKEEVPTMLIPLLMSLRNFSRSRREVIRKVFEMEFLRIVF